MPVEGLPGSGKTTLAIQFLLDGLARGERVLYVTLSESVDELVGVLQSHGWSADGIAMRELAPATDSLNPDERYTMFHPSEVELSEATKTILGDVERLRPHRIVFDSLSEMRLLAGSALRYRRQILALKQYFTGKRSTVLMLDDCTSSEHDMQVHSLAHGVVHLEQNFPEYGVERRRGGPNAGMVCSSSSAPCAMLCTCRSCSAAVRSSSRITVQRRPAKNCFSARIWRR